MQKENKPHSLRYLAVRLFAGAYLLYTAWKLRNAIGESPLFIIAIAAFGIIGAVLLAQAGWKICRGEYEGSQFFNQNQDEEPADETNLTE